MAPLSATSWPGSSPRIVVEDPCDIGAAATMAGRGRRIAAHPGRCRWVMCGLSAPGWRRTHPRYSGTSTAAWHRPRARPPHRPAAVGRACRGADPGGGYRWRIALRRHERPLADEPGPIGTGHSTGRLRRFTRPVAGYRLPGAAALAGPVRANHATPDRQQPRWLRARGAGGISGKRRLRTSFASAYKELRQPARCLADRLATAFWPAGTDMGRASRPASGVVPATRSSCHPFVWRPGTAPRSGRRRCAG